MIKGKVKFFNVTKGFGFITDENGKDVFVHFSQLNDSNDSLKENDIVTFEMGEGNKGPMATKVTVIGHGDEDMA